MEFFIGWEVGRIPSPFSLWPILINITRLTYSSFYGVGIISHSTSLAVGLYISGMNSLLVNTIIVTFTNLES